MKYIYESFSDPLSIKDLPDEVKAFLDSADKKRFLKGPNGNICIGYYWEKVKGEKWSNYEGGFVGALVSDWDKASECMRCGRRIVHNYFVYYPKTQDIRAVGKECLALELGFPYLKPAVFTSIMRKQEEIERKIQDQIHWIETHYIGKCPLIMNDPEEAIYQIKKFFNERNYSFNPSNGLKICYNKKTTDVIAFDGRMGGEIFDSAFHALEFEYVIVKNFGKDLDDKLKSIFPKFLGR